MVDGPLAFLLVNETALRSIRFLQILSVDDEGDLCMRHFCEMMSPPS